MRRKSSRRLPPRQMRHGLIVNRKRSNRSPGADQPDRLVLAEKVTQLTQRLAARGRQRRIARQNGCWAVACSTELFAVHFGTSDLKAGQAALARPEQIPFAA